MTRFISVLLVMLLGIPTASFGNPCLAGGDLVSSSCCASSDTHEEDAPEGAEVSAACCCGLSLVPQHLDRVQTIPPSADEWNNADFRAVVPKPSRPYYQSNTLLGIGVARAPPPLHSLFSQHSLLLI